MTIEKEKNEILLDAVEHDSFENVQQLLKDGLDIKDLLENEENILHRCFASKSYTLSQHFILHGVDYLKQNNLGRTPLHIACRSGFFEGVHLITLLTQNINQQDHKGRTPLMHAIKFKQLLLIKILMARGSDIDLKDNNGFPSLLWAVKYLDPAELREMMSADLNDKLEEQVRDAISNEDMNLEVSDALIEDVLDNEDSTEDDPEEYVLPNYLKEAIGEKDTTEHISSYSITDHLEKLKEKSEEEGFTYELALLEEAKNRPELITEAYTREKVDLKDQDIEVIDMNFNKNNLNQEINSISYKNNLSFQKQTILHEAEKFDTPERGELDVNEIDQEATSRISLNEKANESQESINDKAKSDTESEEAISIKDNSSQEEQNQSAKIKRSKYQEKIQETMVGSGSVDHIKQSSAKVKGKAADLPEGKSTIKERSAQNNENEEVQRIKHAKSINLKLEKEIVTDESTPIIVEKKSRKKKNLGHNEQYDQKLGAIRTFDKTISTEKISDIETVNKNITDATISKIKTVDKQVAEMSAYEKYSSGVMNEEQERSTISGWTSEDEEAEDEIQELKKAKEELLKRQEERAKRPQLEINKLDKETVIKGTLKTTEDSETISSEDMIKKNVNLELEGEKETAISSATIKDKEKQEKEQVQVITDKNSLINNEDIQEESQEEKDDEELSHIVDVDQKNGKGQTLVWMAAQKGRTNMLKKLIQRGADFEVKDKEGVSPFMVSAIFGKIEIAEYLSEKVRNIDEKRRDEHTALSLAVGNNQSKVIQLLTDKGARLDTKIKGNDLLMHAASVGALGSIKTLILLGLDPNAKNFKGKKAVDIAKFQRKKKAHALLLNIIKSRKG